MGTYSPKLPKTLPLFYKTTPLETNESWIHSNAIKGNGVKTSLRI